MQLLFRADASIIEVTKEVLKGRNYVIFPEGTRSKNGNNVGDFKGGSFKAATKAKCPIVLCCIQNTCKVYERFKFKSTKVYYDIVEVIPYEDIENKTTQEISDYSYEVIKNNLENLPKY